MNYQVLARRWRPKTFAQVVGQSHIVKPLLNALRHDRLHHAYLFTGTRGVGKTTIARILAKAINCTNPQDFDPCGECAVCQAVDEGRFMDLIEVDAASHTNVAGTRELLDNAQYAPHQGRYKVYLIDEVHMLSGHSFNALLKTLEEPPLHVKFLLATTDPQKIPATVLSRCLQFNLKRLLPEQIFEQMQAILKEEQIEAEPQALQLLARAADGSMRDGLSLLDQAIVVGAGKITVECVTTMLGTTAQQPIADMLNALVKGDANTILAIIDEYANVYPDFSPFLENIIYALHRIALAQLTPVAIEHEFDKDMLLNFAKLISPEDIQLYYQIALHGQKDLELTPDSRMGFEMVMLRMLAFKPVKVKAENVSSQQVSAKPQKVSSTPDQVNPSKPLTSEMNASISSNDEVSITNQHWVDMIAEMKLDGMVKELACNCALKHLEDNHCTLLLDSSHQQLLNPGRQQKLEMALQNYCGNAIKLEIKLNDTEIMTPAIQAAQHEEARQQAAIDAINEDANIQALKEHFDARVLPGTIEPV